MILVLDLSVALPHDMDVLNVKEDELHVLVIVLALVTSPLQPHRLGIHLNTTHSIRSCNNRLDCLGHELSFDHQPAPRCQRINLWSRVVDVDL